MAHRLKAGLARLTTLVLPELRAEWGRVLGTPAPRITPNLLRVGISHRLQERVLGGLSRASRAALRTSGRSSAPSIKPGTRLVRNWQGRTVPVLAEEGGFLFEDRRYTSLSAIAGEARPRRKRQYMVPRDGIEPPTP